MFHSSASFARRLCEILLAGFLVVGVLVLSNGHAFAYNTEGPIWANQPAAGVCCASLTVDEFGFLDTTAVGNALNAWNNSPALVWLNPIFTGLTTTGPLTISYSDVFGVGWDGITNYSWDGNNHFTQVSVVINNVYVSTYTAGEAQGVIVHELGHAMGLAHSSGCAIMVPDTYTRWFVCSISTPQQDDINGINSLY